ncbi:MAG: mismatch repair protein MutT [Microbacteriaceae bacterium]|nr:mismatch repair protein MutT [Microbacteriaceae bacterium]
MTLVAGPSIVQAAGAVCWRVRNGKTEVLLVHRDAHKDVSLPKGKVDPGETPPQTAVREISEETGLAITLGAPLGTTEYTMPNGRAKIVYYWSAEISDAALAASTFAPNDEIAALQWLPIDAARAALSYDRDQDVLDRFAARDAAGTTRTFPVIVLRHGKAVPPGSWDGPDSTRPLLHRGLEQSQNVAPAIAAWGPVTLISSTATRCLTTIEPLATLMGLEVKAKAGISQDAYEDDTARVRHVVRKRLEKKRAAVICSHGPVIPQIIDEVAGGTGTPIDAALRRAAMLSTSEYTVMHVSIEHPLDGLVAVETHGPALD